MGIKERKEREKNQLRAKIMDATAEILIREGYEKTTIRKVAQAIEYSPRTVYLYFKDKDSLLMEIIEEGFAATLTKKKFIKDQLDYSQPEQIFGVQIMNNIESALSKPNLYKAIVYLLQYKAYPPGPHQLAVIRELKNDLENCYSELGMESTGLEIKAELVFAYLRGFNLMLINKIGSLSEKEIQQYVQECIQSILTGIVETEKKT